MIEWGLYGLGTGSAGLYLANYHRMLGSYFADVYENEWPGISVITVVESLGVSGEIE